MKIGTRGKIDTEGEGLSVGQAREYLQIYPIILKPPPPTNIAPDWYSKVNVNRNKIKNVMT